MKKDKMIRFDNWINYLSSEYRYCVLAVMKAYERIEV